MYSSSNLADIDVIRRREFVNSFVSEIISNLYGREVAKEVEKEIENELLKGIGEQNKEIERIKRIEEARFITRQFVPSIINPTPQVAEQLQVPTPTEVQEKTETAKEEEPLIIGSKIDPLLSGDAKTIECADSNIRIKKNQEFEETDIVLSENEIRDVVKKFSELTKIPIVDNVLRASIRNFAIIAIISDKIGSRFLIQRTDVQEQSMEEVKMQKPEEFKKEVKKIETKPILSQDKRWYVTIEQPVEEIDNYAILKEIERKNKETERVMEEQAKKLKKEFMTSIISKDS